MRTKLTPQFRRIDSPLRRTKATGHLGLMRPVPQDTENTMLKWLAQAAKETRKERGRKPVHIAASLSSDQSTVTRFEKAEAWPRDPDAMIAAYADDLDIDPRKIWARALELWQT